MTTPLKLNTKVTEKQLQTLQISTDGFGAWSHSKLKLLDKCPLSFYLKYVLKVKVPQPPVSLVTEVGKAAHYIIENMLMGKDLQTSMSIAKKKYIETIGEENWSSQVETLEMSFIKFMERLENFQKHTKIKRYLQELRIGCTKNWTPTGFFADDVYFRGVIDLVIQLENGDIIPIDHKTGAPAIMGVRNFKDQLNTYKVLFHYGIEKVKGGQSGIHYIRDADLKMGDYSSKDEIENKLRPELEFHIEGSIERLKEIGYFKHAVCNLCKYCEFAEPCKSGQLKDLEKKTVRFFKKQ